METSISLLASLRYGESRRWEDFVDRYRLVLRCWCDQWGVPSEDADDLIQETFVKVYEGIAAFERQQTGSFRRWLKVIARHCWCEVIRKAKQRGNVTLLNDFTSSSAPLVTLGSGVDRLVEEELLAISMQRARRAVDERNWEAFRRTVLVGTPPGEVAAELGITLGHVYVAKSRVQKRVLEELQRIQ